MNATSLLGILLGNATEEENANNISKICSTAIIINYIGHESCQIMFVFSNLNP
jgi:hypothetical protein